MDATDKQIVFVRRLADERDLSHYATGPISAADVEAVLPTLDRKQVSQFIDRLLACPHKPKPATPKPTPADRPHPEPGMYRDAEGTMYKVQKTREGDRYYAKRLVKINGRRVNEQGDEIAYDFVYAPGALRTLTPAMKMTLEQAREFGIKYGVCCVCGAFLKDAKSVRDGIGPWCRKRTAWRAA